MENAMEIVRPVSPGDSGGGFPYAPEHWPNPGDIWVWRVGHRFTKSGTFHDRYLRLPKTLCKGKSKPLEFQSKPAVERYLRSNFPEADISAFFASFTWVIRVKPELIGTYVYSPRIKRSPVKKLEKNKNKRMRGAARTPKVETPSRINDHGCINIASNGEETRLALSTGLASSSLLGSHVSGDFNGSQADPHPDEFDNYLNNLDENLDSPVSMHQLTSSMKESRKKLSSLLAMTTPNSLLTSEDSNELIALSYKLQNDPNLSTEELSILKLIQSIPFISKSFLEAKEISSKADDFFCGLNTKIATVASLKEEYNASREEIKDVKADEASALLRIMWIDQKISKLERLKQEEADKIEVYGEKLIRLNSIQKTVMGSLPKVVDEVQMAKSEKSMWELKKKKAAEIEAEILARFAPLDGFSF